MPDADDVILAPDDPIATASRTLSFALGNGVLFVLAVDPESAFADDGPSGPVCFFAGGRLLDLPNGLALSWRHEAETEWFRPQGDDVLSCEHRLLMQDGVAERELLVEDARGRQTQWRETRLVSLTHPHLVMLRWELTPRNWSGPILVRSQVDLRAQRAAAPDGWAHEGAAQDVQNLMPADGLAARVTGPDAGQKLRIDVTLHTSGAPCRQAGRGHERDVSCQQRRLELTAGETAFIDVGMSVSDDSAPAPPPSPGFAQERVRQRAAWQTLWRRVQVAAPRDAALERALRFNAFHLMQAVSPYSVGRDVGLPAWSAPKGAPGHEAWDETLAMPFYSLHLPALARELLRHRAKRMQGDPPRSWRSAVAFSVWQHHVSTRDVTLLGNTTGALLVAGARDWLARAPGAGSLLAAWTLRHAALLREQFDGAGWTRFSEALGVAPAEPGAWHAASRTMPVPWLPGGVLALPAGDGIDTLTLLHLLGPADATELLVHMGARPDGDWYARTVRHHVADRASPTGVSRIASAGALAAVDRAASWAHFHKAAHALLQEPQTVDDGLSFGAMAGVWDVLQRHYLGLQPQMDGLRVCPRPPDALDDVEVRVALAGHWLTARLHGRQLSLKTDPGAPPLMLRHEGRRHVLTEDAAWTVECR